MAWVPAALSSDGTGIELSQPDGGTVPASVTHQAFHDPDGELLRS
jgi:hypothetical protein